MNTNPEHELYRAVLNVLMDFPGLGLVSIRTDPYGIEVSISNGVRGAGQIFPFASWMNQDPEVARDGIFHLIGNMVESVQPQGPGPGATWSWGDRAPF